MRTLPHHVRNADCTAKVTAIVNAELGDYNELECGHGYTKPSPVHKWGMQGRGPTVVAAVGEVVVCEGCQTYRAALTALEAALKAGIVSHTRCHTVSPDIISVYQYDRSSPSGFLSIHGCALDDTPEARDLISRYQRSASPLSPTEKR